MGPGPPEAMPKVAAMKTPNGQGCCHEDPNGQGGCQEDHEGDQEPSQEPGPEEGCQEGPEQAHDQPAEEVPWPANSAPVGHPVLWQGLPKLDLGPSSEPTGSLPDVPDFLA